ncbi:MAG: TlpA disulfide reductase family protein [Thermoanaerobaculia bacterium]|nr:TlpA disulfide reductase family protein [Thermoanaerobaculia bacterium]
MRGLAAALAVALALGPAPAPATDLLAAALPVETVDGTPITRGDLAGKVVLVDFWASWCAPCLAQLPTLKRLYARHGGHGLEIVGVSVELADTRRVVGWVRRQELSWPQVHDRRGVHGELARLFGVESVPRSFLFDREGRLVALDLPPRALEATVEALMRLRDRPGGEEAPGTLRGGGSGG